jgi:O-antigen/teichoic acid export membrane protein
MSPRFTQLFSDTFFYSLGLILRRGLSIITLPIFTRYLSQGDFGIIAIATTVRELLTTLLEFGLPNASARFYYECQTEQERRRLFGTLLLFLLPASFFLCLLFLWVGPLLWDRIAPKVPFRPYISLTIITVFLSSMAILPRTSFRVTNRVRLYMTIGLIQGVLIAGLSIALVTVWNWGALGPILGNLGGSGVFFFVFFVYLKPQLAWEFSPRVVSQSLTFGLPDILVRISFWMLRLADRLILQIFAPLSVVGLYSVGYTLGGLAFDLVASSINSAIIPFFYQTATEESEQMSKRIFANVAAYNVALFCFLGVGTILFAREVIVILATSRYLAAEAIVPVITWGSIFSALTYIPNRSIYWMKKTSYLPVMLLIPAALNIGLNFLLIPQHGMLGAAWATFVANLVLICLSWWISLQIYPIPYDYWRMAKPLFLLLALSQVKDLIPTESLVTALCLKSLVVAAFPIALLASGFVTTEERRAFGQLASRTGFWPTSLRRSN